MPNPAEAFLIILAIVLVFAGTRLNTLGDMLGQVLRGGVHKETDKVGHSRDQNDEPTTPEST